MKGRGTEEERVRKKVRKINMTSWCVVYLNQQ